MDRDAKTRKRSLRIGVLLYDSLQDENSAFLQMLLLLRHGIESSGHVCLFSPKSQTELKHDMTRIARMISTSRADAWIVMAGSRDLLQWFVDRDIPVFGCGGLFMGLPVAGSGINIGPAIGEVTRQLLDLRHRRIVFVAPEVMRHSRTSAQLVAFSSVMEEHGVPIGPYHIPEWEETHEGFLALVESLFLVTPPTAIIVTEPAQAVCVMSYLARRGWQMPRDLSLVLIADSQDLAMCQPRIVRFQMRDDLVTRDMQRWVAALAKNQQHWKQIQYDATIHPGGSIGPPREGADGDRR